MKIALVVALLGSALATPAVAQTAITENFDSEAGGSTALSYNSFSQFDVTNGSVDVLHQPNSFSLNCVGGGGSCVDLGSGLIGHSQKMTVAASATAEKKTVGQRS